MHDVARHQATLRAARAPAVRKEVTRTGVYAQFTSGWLAQLCVILRCMPKAGVLSQVGTKEQLCTRCAEETLHCRSFVCHSSRCIVLARCAAFVLHAGAGGSLTGFPLQSL